MVKVRSLLSLEELGRELAVFLESVLSLPVLESSGEDEGDLYLRNRLPRLEQLYGCEPSEICTL